VARVKSTAIVTATKTVVANVRRQQRAHAQGERRRRRDDPERDRPEEVPLSCRATPAPGDQAGPTPIRKTRDGTGHVDLVKKGAPTLTFTPRTASEKQRKHRAKKTVTPQR